MPQNVSIPHTTVNGIITERCLSENAVGLERFEIKADEGLTVPAGHKIDVNRDGYWIRIYFPTETWVDGPLRYTNPKQMAYTPPPGRVIKENVEVLSILFMALFSGSVSPLLLGASLDDPMSLGSAFWAFGSVAAGVFFGGLATFWVVSAVNRCYRRSNPTPPAEEFVKSHVIVFPGAPSGG